MTEHTVEIDGMTYRPGDVVLDANGDAWQAVGCVSASGENAVAFVQVGQPRAHLTWFPPRPLMPMVTHERFMQEVDALCSAVRKLQEVGAIINFFLRQTGTDRAALSDGQPTGRYEETR